MANLSVRKTPTAPATAPQSMRSLIPERFWTEWLNWDPFREMAPVFPEDRSAFLPAFEVKETKTGYVFKADLPGVSEKDLDIQLTGNRLAIAGKREAEKQEQGENFYCVERTYGSFTRAFTLPEGIDPDHVSATLKDGVLTVAVAKKPEVQPRTINVQAEKAKA